MSDQRLHAIVFNAITRADYARLMLFSYRKRIADAVTEALVEDGWRRLADADHDTFRERVSGWASRHGTHSFGDNVVDEILAATFGKVVPGE